MSRSHPAIDVERARAETPGAEGRVHLNNCGAALMPACVVEASKQHLEREAQLGGYEAERAAAAEIQNSYDAVARLLGASPDEIAIMENATRAWDMAFYAFPFQPGDRILTSVSEYASNYIAYLQLLGRRGIVIDVVPDDASGQLDMGALERMIDDRVRLISLTHVPTQGGLVQPVAEVGALARAHQIPFMLDACQSVGQMPLDVDALGVDVLSGTSRKFLRGPRGVGFLYVRRSLIPSLEPPFLDLRSATWTAPDRYVVREDARRFETWESNIAAKIGLGVAVDYALGWGLDAIEARIQALSQWARTRLAGVPGVRLHDRGVKQCGIVTLDVAGCDAGKLAAELGARNINVSVSPRENALLDLGGRGLTELLRLGIHYYNTQEELERFARELETLTHKN